MANAGDQIGPFMVGVTADGTRLVYTTDGEQGGGELRIHNIESGEDELLVSSTGSIGRGALHKDGELLAYTTTMNGERRAMIKFIDDNDPGVPMVPGRSGAASWAGDRLYALSNNEIIAIDVTTNGRDISVSQPVHIADGDGVRHLSAFPDGERLLLIRDHKEPTGGSIRIVKNWLGENGG